MCERRVERDERGRLLKGHTANPRGRRPLSAAMRLVEAADAAGATVLVLLPPSTRTAAADDSPLPPAAA
jgi:hypothetical protein